MKLVAISSALCALVSVPVMLPTNELPRFDGSLDLVEAVAEAFEPPEDDAPGCTYGGRSYSEGSVICISETEYKCNGGAWESLGTSCPEDGPVEVEPDCLPCTTGYACVLEARTHVQLRVYDEVRGRRGRLLWSGWLNKGQRQTIVTSDRRLRYDYRLQSHEPWRGDVGAWCHRGDVKSVP